MDPDLTLAALNELVAAPTDREVPCARLIGVAGSGKTTMLMKRAQADPHDLLLTSTTGISAVNLGTITLNSTLSYYDTLSMRDAYLQGRLVRKLHEVAREYQWLAVEEYSMLDADQLDILYRAVAEANNYSDVKEPLGILLVGDLAQLPPVKARWCFEADSWERFAQSTTRLDHVWRQDGGLFLDALNLIRRGDGPAAADTLTRAGVRWESMLHTEFDGTTILPKNDQVDRFNALAMDRVKGLRITVASRRWGKQRKEWDHIPPVLNLKVGAYVMVLANQPDFSVVNGDCGYVCAHVPRTPDDPEHVIVHLVRTGREVNVYHLVRGVEQADRPDTWGVGVHIPKGDDDDGNYLEREHYRGAVKRYVLGQVEYIPLRVAYASTVHKSQSLTLDRVQCDYRDGFFAKPAMMYVALSRCRTLAGLRLVGMREVFAKKCTIDPRVKEWL